MEHSDTWTKWVALVLRLQAKTVQLQLRSTRGQKYKETYSYHAHILDMKWSRIKKQIGLDSLF